MRTTMRESAPARAAFETYWDLGNGRSLQALLKRFQSVPEPPTTRLQTLKEWSARYHWQARIAERELSLAEKAEAQMVEDRVREKRERLERARLLYKTGQEVLDRFLEKAKQLDAMPLVAQEWRDEKGRLRRRWEGIASLVPPAIRAIETGHKEERLERGEFTDHTRLSLSEVLDTLPEGFREEVEDEMLRLLKEGDRDGF